MLGKQVYHHVNIFMGWIHRACKRRPQRLFHAHTLPYGKRPQRCFISTLHRAEDHSSQKLGFTFTFLRSADFKSVSVC